MQDLPIAQVKDFQMKMLKAIEEKEPRLMGELEATGTLSDGQRELIANFAKEFAVQYRKQNVSGKEGVSNGEYS